MQYGAAMKIDRTGPIRSNAPVKRNEKAGKPQGAAFAKHMDAKAEAGGGAGPVAPVQSVDALLSIQEVDDATSEEARAKAQRWAVDLLDQLDALRLRLIAGAIPRQDLERIAAMVQNHRVRTDDPQLSAILDEIELRARVELAKYDSRT